MEYLYSILLTVQVLTALGIIGLVLMQHGKGADMGASFGSGASGSLFGASGSANFLSRSTAWLAAVFFAATLGLAWVAKNSKIGVSNPKAIPGSVLDQPAPSGATPSPSGATPTPSGTTPPPSGATPPPSGATPAPAGVPAGVPAGPQSAPPSAPSVTPLPPSGAIPPPSTGAIPPGVAPAPAAPGATPAPAQPPASK